ncbi:T9SS type A sorting domain-containing protein [bacterium]|nr:T9SS type A sorting domain-containing protein [bacterium]
MRRNPCSNLLPFKIGLAVVVFFFVPCLFSQISLEGTVKNNAGEPVENAFVELIDNAVTSRSFSDYTDSEGKYSIQITETGMDSHTANPEAFRLSQNYPNPFNPSTVISYDLPYPSKIRLDIHNILGQKVRTLFDGFQPELSRHVVWNATDETGHGVPAGVYIYSLRAEGVRISRKMLLIDGGASAARISNPAEIQKLGKPLSIQYLLRITGTDIETYELPGILISENKSFNVTVFKTGTDLTVTDVDGNVYKTVKIGDQWWMAENLKVTHYRNGDEIPNVTDETAWTGLSTGAKCAYENNESNAEVYGYLYNWYSVKDSRNIAPAGWHVPTYEEWNILIDDYLGENFVAGGKMKEVGTTHWWSPNESATNECGFSGLPGGHRNVGRFYTLGAEAFFWSATEIGESWADHRSLSYENPYIGQGGQFRHDGLSVRLIKD